MNKNHIKELAQVIADIEDRKTAENFLSNILTPGELEEIAQRLQIVKMLLDGIPQRTITEKLGVSIATVTRGSRELKYGKDGFIKVLKQ